MSSTADDAGFNERSADNAVRVLLGALITWLCTTVWGDIGFAYAVALMLAAITVSAIWGVLRGTWLR